LVSSPNDRNRIVIDEFRANGGKVGTSTHPAGDSLVLITTTGAKSGRSHTTPLVYHRDGNRVVIIASKGGAPENPSWYHNLVANPEVAVEIGAEKYRAKATVPGPEERDRLYAAQVALFPGFADYEKRTTRKIPVVVLDRV
jgi:deazaflavin-dependent oxidoreductase (nitroreductase family)